MAFNRLVQPECGGPNPLVAAAQQITSRPRAPMGEALMRQVNPLISANHPFNSQLNFTKDFAKQYNGKGSIHQTKQMTRPILQQQQQPQQPQQDTQLVYPSTSNIVSGMQQHYEPMMNYMLRDRVHIGSAGNQYANQLGPQQSQQMTAGEQLETKYRNDMISSTKATNLAQETSNVQGRRVDDVEFWQSLSQKYIGPSTYDNIAKFKQEQASTSQQQENMAASSTSQAGIDQQLEDNTVRLGDADYDASKWFEPVSVNETEYIFDERNPLKDEFEDPFAEGLKRLEQGDIPSAALLFEAAVQREPENSLAWQYLGTTQAQNEKDTSAIRALRQCLGLNPADQKARLAIAVSLANELQRNESCKHLLEWLIRHDRYKSLNASLGYFDQLVNNITDDDADADLYGGENFATLNDKRYDYVRDKFVDAARMSPRDPDPEVQNSLGVIFNMRGEYDKAVDCFKAALSVRSEDSLLWNRLGATLANGNKSDEAIAAYRKALDLAPGFLRTRYNLAISLIHLNLYDEAAKQLVQILNMQAAGKGSKNVQIRTRSITSTSIWNTLRTVATLLNKPELYSIIDGRDLDKCNERILLKQQPTTSAAGYNTERPIGPTLTAGTSD